MPDQSPATTENTPIAPNDADTAAAVLTGEGGMGPGGGGLGAQPAPHRAEGGTAPNAPIDIATPDLVRAEAGEPEVPRADRDAGVEAAGDPTEPESDAM